MDAFNVPPSEDWWEHNLRTQASEDTCPRAATERTPATHSRADSGVRHAESASAWDLPVLDLEYAVIAASALEFAQAVSARRDLRNAYEILVPAAQRVAEHLARGHALGTDDATLCGNIVCCRWGLAEARSCEATLTRIVSRLGRPEFAGLLDRCRTLCAALDERIDSLRQRVWW